MQRMGAFIACWVVGAVVAIAQVSVSLQLPFASRMPARLSEWRENESLIRIQLLNPTQAAYSDLVVSVELTKDGQRIARTRDGHPRQPRLQLGPGETRSLSWREAINEQAIEYDRTYERELLTSGELPEGNYQLCVRVLDAALRPISQPACGNFPIVLADPPQIIAPRGGDTVSVMPLLQWTPSSPTQPGVMYRVTIKVRFQGQTPAQAMASNPVRLTVDVPTTTYQVPIEHQLGPDAADPNYAGHVWQVQALLNGLPYGRNRGLSQIEYFIVPPMAVDPVKPPHGHVPVWAWDIPYDEIVCGRPVILEAPESTADTGTIQFVLHFSVPKELSWKSIQTLIGNSAPSGDTLRVQPVIVGRIRMTSKEVPIFAKKWRRPGYKMVIDRASDTLFRYGGFYVYDSPSDTTQPASSGYQKPWPGGYYVFRLPADSTQSAEYVGHYENMTELRQRQWGRIERGRIKLNEPVDIVGLRRGNAVLAGSFTPTHIALPVTDIVVDGGFICELPPLLDTTNQNTQDASATAARYTGYILSTATASGAPRASGKTLGAVTRQGAPSSQGQRPLWLPKPSDVGIPDFRLDTDDYSDEGFVICWLPPLDPTQSTEQSDILRRAPLSVMEATAIDSENLRRASVGVLGEVSDEGITYMWQARLLDPWKNRRLRVYLSQPPVR